MIEQGKKNLKDDDAGLKIIFYLHIVNILGERIV